ncbi:MAG: DUF4105 domain-containing protein [Salinibacter sp.]
MVRSYSGLLGVFLLALIVLPLDATAQPGPDRLSAESHVSLITILPGDPMYTFAGHSAVRVSDPEQNLDRLYNYGTFDFNDPLFVPKFMYGHLRYFLSVAQYSRALQVYEEQERPVIEQRLNLTRQQRTALYQFLRTNALPNNRYYQYDFFFDNCSTRIRDALQQTLGDNVAFAGEPNPTESFREMLDPYVADRPVLDVGFDIALGRPADRSPTAGEAMFLPEYLMAAFDNARVTGRGGTRSLVSRTDTVQWVEGYNTTREGTHWPSTLAWGFLGLVVLWTGTQATLGRAPSGRGDALLFATVGTVGLTICFLWFIATYSVTTNNLNLLWAWPTHLVAARQLMRRPSSKALRYYLLATALTALVLAGGWPFWPQGLHDALLPLTIGVGVRAGWWAFVTSSRRLFLL